MNVSETAYLVIDWGTTNFRIFALDKNDLLLGNKSLPMGLLQVKNNEFAKALEGVLINWIENYQTIPVFMAGMVGSAKGWHNAGYVDSPVSLYSIADNAIKFTLPWGAHAYIMPGVRHAYDIDKFDVMRGEETQILGLSISKSLSDFTAVLPGTHSKHVIFRNNELVSFESYLTGEFYSMVINHSLIGKELPKSDTFNHFEFEKGVKDSQNTKLTQSIFLGWTRRLFKQVAEKDISDYVSGLLIGYELQSIVQENIYIVGGEQLSQRYELACKALSINSQCIDGDLCFLSGMQVFRKFMNNKMENNDE